MLFINDGREMITKQPTLPLSHINNIKNIHYTLTIFYKKGKVEEDWISYDKIP